MPSAVKPSSQSGPPPGARRAIAERLRAAGLRVTAQRVAILETLEGRPGHPTVDEIYRGVQRYFPMISLNTVYKTLNALRELGELTDVGAGEDGAIRFDSNLAPHLHVVCLRCRRIQDVRDAVLGSPLRLPRRLRGFAVIGHRVELLGYCRECRQVPGPPVRRSSRRRTVPSCRGGRGHR